MWLRRRHTMGGGRARCMQHITRCRGPLDTTAPRHTLTLPSTLSPLLTRTDTQVLMHLGTCIRAKGPWEEDLFKPSFTMCDFT